MSLAVVMITFNEEFHIAEAIRNVRDIADEIYVLDSYSTDRTVDLALTGGAVVLQRHFTNFGDQWNFALKKFPIRSEWTMKLDPDERLGDVLKENIRNLKNSRKTNGYFWTRRLWFMGYPLRAGMDVLRLWRTGKCRFTDNIVNEYPLVEGRVEKLSGYMEHLDCRSLEEWIAKQNRYTTMEALSRLQGEFAVPPKLFGNRVQQMMWIKKVFYHIPLRYLLLTLVLFFAKGAFRSGINGWYWTKLRVEHYYRIIELKMVEIRRRGQLPVIATPVTGRPHPVVSATELQRKVNPNHE